MTLVVGDRAQLEGPQVLAALALSTTTSTLGVWFGGTLGMATASGIAVLIGATIWTRLRPRTVQIATATLFAVVGIVLLIDAASG